MGTTASAEVAIPAPAKRTAASRDARLTGALVAAAIVLGFIAQPIVPRGPWALVGSTVIAALAILVAAFAVRGQLLTTLAGFRFATVIVSVLGFAAAAGTLILQGKPRQFYFDKYGSPGIAIVALHMDDLFHSLWFGGLMALLIAGLVVSAYRRFPIRLKNLGFHACHLGLLLVMAGAGLTTMLQQKGRVNLHVGGEPAKTAVLADGSEVPLGFTMSLQKFDVERHASNERIGVYMQDKGEWKLKASFDPVVGEKHRLPDGASFQVLAYYPDLAITEEVHETTMGGTPALRVGDQWLTPDGRARLDIGTTAVLFGERLPTAPDGKARHEIGIEGGPSARVELGQTVALGALKVKALRFLPHFSYDLESKSAVSVDDQPVNPALEVEVAGKKEWLFARAPGYHQQQGGPKLVYAWAPAQAAQKDVVLVSAEDRKAVLVEGGRVVREAPLADGLELGGVKLAQFVEHAEKVPRYSTRSQEPRNPAVLLSIDDGHTTGEQLFVAAERAGTQFGKGNAITFEKREEEVKAYKSAVKVENGTEVKTAVVAVNDPLSFGGWSLYQSNYDPNDPTYSGIDVVHDPGVPFVFAGFAFLAGGILYMFYVTPRLRREA